MSETVNKRKRGYRELAIWSDSHKMGFCGGCRAIKAGDGLLPDLACTELSDASEIRTFRLAEKEESSSIG